jgi:hypothetical protein
MLSNNSIDETRSKNSCSINSDSDDPIKRIDEKINALKNDKKSELDLRELNLDETNFDYVQKKLNSYQFIDNVLWKNVPESNNSNLFSSFPTDYVHCLLTYYCLYHTDTDNLNKKIENDVDLKFWENNQQEILKNVCFINQRTKNIVVVLNGFELKIKDFFKKSFLGFCNIDSIENILSKCDDKDQSEENKKDPVPICNLFSVYSFMQIKEAIELSNRNQYKDFSLSFTGYGLGAWQAEQAIYFASQKLDTNRIKVVTFDSPGSLIFLEKLKNEFLNDIDLKNLNIVTYLSTPNFLNTCNQHVGKVFRIFNKNVDSEYIKRLIQFIPSPAKEPIQDYFEKITDLEKYKFCYLNGIRSLFKGGLKSILQTFDRKTGKPLRLKSISKWPLIKLQASNGFKKLRKKLSSNLMKTHEKTWNDSSLTLVDSEYKLVEICLENLINGMCKIIFFVIKLLSGKLYECKEIFDPIVLTKRFFIFFVFFYV